MKRALARVAALLFSLLLFLATGEAALRFVYRDAGRTTLGGPGGRPFDHLTIGPEELRGRRDTGPKRAGVPRILVLGDSITYGQGVHDWHDTWPERLAVALEAAQRPHEMAVFAVPGRDMPQHLQELERSGRIVNPDVLIYQWYVNDIEVMSHRPDGTRRWQRWPWHDWLRRRSYLYYFLDNRLTQFVPAADRSYVDYILQDFVPGSAEWTEFERYFHTFATEARALAARRIMLLYPQVPFRDRYPLQPVHDRMKALAAPHTLSIAPVAWVRSGGALAPDDTSPWHQSLSVPAGFTGAVVDTREYVFLPGTLEAELTLSRTGATDAGGAIATLKALDTKRQEVLAEYALDVPAGQSDFQAIVAPLAIPGPDARRIRFRVNSTGRAAWKLATIGAHVDYGLEVLDLTPMLSTFDTHASIFDAHPNAAAHKVIADAVYRVLTETR
jgi:lysophospholipase L1-like esterase